MSSAKLTAASPVSAPDLPAPELADPYRRLLRVLRAGRGMFTLVPVESNLNEEERGRVVERLRGDLAEEGLLLREVELTYQDWDPVEVLEKTLGSGTAEPLVLLLVGLERTPTGPVSTEGVARPPAFARLNQARELLERRYPVPTIVWCEPHTYGTFRRHAPDFFDHFTGLVRLHVPREPRGQDRVDRVELPPRETVWAPREELSSAAAVRFYEERLESRSLDEEQRVRALLGLAGALVERRSTEGIAALDRAAECAEEAIRRLDPETNLEAWSRANGLLARARGELGRPGAALGPAEAAVEGSRRLSEESQGFRQELGVALSHLSNILSALGRRQEALKAIQQVVDIYRDLARSQPDAFRPNLALGLNNLSLRLSDLDRREEALEAIQQAVEIRRKLARSRPDTFRPDLARSLGALHLRLRDSGQERAALAAITEALDLLEPLFQELPRAFASLMASVARDYEKTAVACGVQPDEERLRSIRETLASVQDES